MIVCRKCGFRNGDADTFCGTCGSFLEWTGEKQQAAQPAAAAQEDEAQAVAPPPPKVGFFQRVMDGANTFIAGPRDEVEVQTADAAPPKSGPGSGPGKPAGPGKAAPAPPARAAAPPLPKAAPPPPPKAPPPPPPRKAPPPPPRRSAPPAPASAPAQPAEPPVRPAAPPPPPRKAPPPPPRRSAPAAPKATSQAAVDAAPAAPAPAAAPAAALVAPVVPGAAKAKPEPTGPAATQAAAAAAPAPEIKEQAPQIARARAVAVTKTTSTRRLRPGDSICGYCGEGNPLARKFCSRCGESLVEAAHVKTPWWHRFRPRRGPKTVKIGSAAGKNAKGRDLHAHGFNLKHVAGQIYRKARIVVAVALLAAGTVYGVYPPFRTTVNSIFTTEKTKLSNIVDQKFAPIHAVTCTANAQIKGHPAALACDGFFNNYWLARWKPAPEPTLTLTFAHPVTITRMILHNGAFGRYVQDGRPSSLHLVFSNEESFTITPQDTPQAQTFSIKHAILIKSVVIQITATYQGTVGTNVAISQIEMFGIQ
jgi:hypothetical protein